jgi:hypothetical protein
MDHRPKTIIGVALDFRLVVLVGRGDLEVLAAELLAGVDVLAIVWSVSG